MKTISCLIVMFIFSCPGNLMAQYSQEFKFFSDSFYTVTGNYKTLIRPHLTRHEKQVLDDIHIEFSPSQNIYAQAYINNSGHRVVEVSYGYLAIMHNLVYGYAVCGEKDNPSCYINYIEAVSSAAAHNARAQRTGGALKPVPFFTKENITTIRGCEKLNENDFNNENALRYISGGMDAVLAFTLGHEFAHHFLGHIDSKIDNNKEEYEVLDILRDRESDADAWSIETSFSIGINPSPIMPMWLLFIGTEPNSRGLELQMTHPLAVRRMIRSLKSVRRNMSDDDKKRVFTDVGMTMLEMITRQIDALEHELRNMR